MVWRSMNYVVNAPFKYSLIILKNQVFLDGRALAAK